MTGALGAVLRILGITALVAGGLVFALIALTVMILFGPIIFWLAWNVLDFGSAVGLHDLGFWAIVLATLFLVAGWLGKVVITGIVFLVDPSWFHGAALMHWPAPTFRNFVAVALLALLASRPQARARKCRGRDKRRRDESKPEIRPVEPVATPNRPAPEADSPGPTG